MTPDLAMRATASAIDQSETMTSTCQVQTVFTRLSHHQRQRYATLCCTGGGSSLPPRAPWVKIAICPQWLLPSSSTTMFILQTTTAVLIAFLAVLAYNEIFNRLAKGRARRKDLETPSSSTILAANDTKPPISRHDVQTPSIATREELKAHKALYYKLHNLEQYPDILPECQQLLLSLLSSSLADASRVPESGILSVETFSRDRLGAFLKAKDVDVTNQWEDYLARRRAGGSREMFSDVAEAKWWLKQAAPVKYVDGAWLGHMDKVSTPFKYRNIAKNAWQVMSEELGDGDLAKNHVHVYRDLMNDIEAGLPAADSKDFIHPRHELNEVRCWKAALAQLLISLFPHDFLPEILGFNMAYESLPLHLLKTVKELRELRLNPYYFELHISIDNADSGHAAMAMAAVANYVDTVEHDEGLEAARIAWKRVQAGYVLAEGLPTTPECPSFKKPVEDLFPRTATEASMIHIFAAKSFVAHKIHCNSRLRIGRRSLVDWLEPNAFKDAHWQKDFLYDLSNCQPWIIKGDSSKSRLVKELSWEGKMFGSFTQIEVAIVEAWINELGNPAEASRPDATVYLEFTKRHAPGPLPIVQDSLVDYPVLTTEPSVCAFEHAFVDVADTDVDIPLFLGLGQIDITNLLPLWFTSSTLLESLPSVPIRAADTFGSAVVRVLRAQTGFDIEGMGVAGMDEVRRTDNGHAVGIIELGFEMCQRHGLSKPGSMRDIVSVGNAQSVAFAEWMVWVGMRWMMHRDMLIGMAWAFMELHEMVTEIDGEKALLDERSICVLKNIAGRERDGLKTCRTEMRSDEVRKANFQRGVGIARRAIEACLVI
jgi:hypothetical protein